MSLVLRGVSTQSSGSAPCDSLPSEDYENSREEIAVRGLLRWRGDWRCLVRRALHAPHLRACAFPRTPELALTLACV